MNNMLSLEGTRPANDEVERRIVKREMKMWLMDWKQEATARIKQNGVKVWPNASTKWRSRADCRLTARSADILYTRIYDVVVYTRKYWEKDLNIFCNIVYETPAILMKFGTWFYGYILSENM